MQEGLSRSQAQVVSALRAGVGKPQQRPAAVTRPSRRKGATEPWPTPVAKGSRATRSARFPPAGAIARGEVEVDQDGTVNGESKSKIEAGLCCRGRSSTSAPRVVLRIPVPTRQVLGSKGLR